MTSSSSYPFPLVYAIHGGSPAIDISFAVEADGSCQVDVLTGFSLNQLSPTCLGTFTCRLAPPTLAVLRQWAEAVAFSEHQGHPPGTVSLFLSRGGDPLRPVESEPPAGLDASLADAAQAALSSPLSAIEVRAESGPKPSQLQLIITAAGSEPFPLVLFDGEGSGFWLRLKRDDPVASGAGVVTTYEEILVLVGQGVIKQGVIELSPGESLSLPLPAGGENAPTTGSFIFWRAGRGPERRILAGLWSLQPDSTTRPQSFG